MISIALIRTQSGSDLKPVAFSILLLRTRAKVLDGSQCCWQHGTVQRHNIKMLICNKTLSAANDMCTNRYRNVEIIKGVEYFLSSTNMFIPPKETIGTRSGDLSQTSCMYCCLFMGLISAPFVHYIL